MTQSIDRPRHRRHEVRDGRIDSGAFPVADDAITTPMRIPAPQRPVSGPQQVVPAPRTAARHASGPFAAAPHTPAPRTPAAQPFAGYPQPPAGMSPQVQASQPYSPQVPTPPRSNGLATAGLVVGIIAAVFSFIPVIGMVAWGLGPIALLLAVAGLVRSGRARSGRGASIAGIVLSLVALLMCILYTALFVGSVNSVAQQSATVHAVTYKVTTAKKSNVSVVYSQSQNDNLAMASVTDAPAPWSADAQVSGLAGPNVTASLAPDLDQMGRSDTITCTIVEDGVQVAQNSATGPNASVSCMK